MAQNVPPQVITKLKTYYPDTTLVRGGAAECVIVYPAEEGYEALAREVATAIKAASGATVPMKVSSEYGEADRATNLICLGRMTNNELARDLYIWHYILCDDWFPGPGGFVVRTCSDPWGTGKNVVMLGGIDVDGVGAAIEHFKTMVKPGANIVIPRIIKTHFAGMENAEAYRKLIVPKYRSEFIDLKALPYGAEYKMVDAAMYYMATGLEEFAQSYADMLRRWMDEYYKWIPERQITTPKYIIPEMMIDFDQMEECPLIPDDVKLEMTNLIYDYASRMAVHGRIRGLTPGQLNGTGHHNVSESVIYGNRYFRTYYPDVDFERLEQGVASVKIGQETMANSNGFLDNNGGYTRFYPMTSMRLAPAMDDYRYFESGAARRWLDYCKIISGSWGGSFFGYCGAPAIAAWYYNDPEYVWFAQWRQSGRKEFYPSMTETNLTIWAWTYLPNIEPQAPKDMDGIHWMTLHETNYAQLGREGKYINVPRERTFHQLAMREGLERDDQYLRLDGINDGLENGGDGNSIPWLCAGRPWLTNTGKWGAGNSMKYHNTCLVLRDGQMADKLVALCDLQATCDLPASGFVRSVMHEYNGLDWARNIAWVKGRYWVIFDQFVANEPADYSVLCQWMGTGQEIDEQWRNVATNHAHTLVIQSAGGQKPFVTDVGDDRPVMRQNLAGTWNAGDSGTIATMIFGHEKTLPHNYSVQRVADNMCLVTEPERQVLLGVAPLNAPDEAIVLSPNLQVKCTGFAISDANLAFAGVTSFGGQAPLFASDKPLDVEMDLAQGIVTVKVTEPTQLTVRGIAISEDALVAGSPQSVETVPLEARDYTLRVDAQQGPLAAIGAEVTGIIASVKPEDAQTGNGKSYPQTLTEQWRFDVDSEMPAVQCMASGHLNRDGREEIAIGTADGRVICLAPDGQKIWEFATGGGINSIAMAQFADGPKVLAASDDQHLYCLDANGNELWKFTGTGLELTNQAPGEFGTDRYIEGDGEMMVVTTADVDGDGTPEILAGSKTFMHGSRRVFGTLWCLSPAGELKWHLYQSGGTVTSIVPLDAGDGTLHVVFGTGGGTYGRSSYVCDSRGNLVTRHGGTYGEKYVSAAALTEDGPQMVVRLERRDGTVEAYETAEPFAMKWRYRAGGLSATKPVLLDADGDGGAEVLLGSGGGNIFCVGEGEEPLQWRASVGEPVCALEKAKLLWDEEQIVAGASTGGVYIVAIDGEILAHAQMSARVSSLHGAQLAPDGGQTLLVGAENGSVIAYIAK